MSNVLDTLERLEREATAGPWKRHKLRGGWYYRIERERAPNITREIERAEDAALIEAACNALKPLLRVARANLALEAAWEAMDAATDRAAVNAAYQAETAAKVELFAALAALDEVAL